jgi:tetratricopeptide (TPR) repeat protein
MNIAAAATLLAALSCGMAPPLHAAESPDAPGRDPEEAAKELAASLERFNARDPQSPDTLNARLAYAVLLAQMDGGDCRARLDTAQSLLDLASASPALGIALPAGLAHAADAEYKVHSARAACSTPQLRNTELRAALDAAQRAVSLYREAFDAVSMATMQFNCAVAYHDLGDTAAAVSALQTAIAMDRDYGYEDDAEDNYSQLLQWNNQQAGPDQVAARMQDFPERSATLAFGWFPSDAQVTIDSGYSQVADGAAWSFHSSRSTLRSVRKGFAGWKVTFQPAEAHFELADAPLEEPAQEGLAISLAGMLGQFHDFEVARNGEFDNSSADFKFLARVRADVKTLTNDLAARDVPHAQLMLSVAQALKAQQSPDVIQDLVAEDYNFETGTWNGATLEQGVWYNMSAALSLPLEPRVFVQHAIEFAYTHPAPCTADATETTCIEIVLRAIPDPALLAEMLHKLARSARLPRRQQPELLTRTDMRLILDPVTLVAYRRDMRQYSYWWNGINAGQERSESLLELKKTSVVSGPLSRSSGT